MMKFLNKKIGRLIIDGSFRGPKDAFTCPGFVFDICFDICKGEWRTDFKFYLEIEIGIASLFWYRLGFALLKKPLRGFYKSSEIEPVIVNDETINL